MEIKAEIRFDVGQEVFFVLKQEGWSFPIKGAIKRVHIAIPKGGEEIYEVSCFKNFIKLSATEIHSQAVSAITGAMTANKVKIEQSLEETNKALEKAGHPVENNPAAQGH